jgi:hypothetical protein
MDKKKSWSAPSKENATKTHNLYKDSTTDTSDSSSASSPKTGNLIRQAADTVKQKLRGAHHWIFGIREDKSVFKIPASVRGNQTYAYYQTARVLQIQESVKNKTKIADSATNTLFITLTQKYNPQSLNEIDRTWVNAKPAIKKFKERLRNLGMIDYAMTLEAHEAGGCHAHMIAIFDKQLKTHATKGKEYRVNDIELVYKIKKAWANALGYNMDSAFVDVLACGNSGLVGYITKELKKTASCEKALRNAEAGNDRPDDRKKILAFYFADRHRLRLLYVSKGIGAGVEPEPEEDEPPQADLITNVISQTPQGKRVLYTCTVTRAELLKMIKYEEISPYTGAVDAKTAEYEAIMRIFEKRYGISQVLNDKKEIEKVIMKREKIKNMKIQTKMIAQEAMNA